MHDGNESQRTKAQAFLDEMLLVCFKHNCWLSREDEYEELLVAVEPDRLVKLVLRHWMQEADVDTKMSTGCSHSWVRNQNRLFEECSDCKLPRRVRAGEPT